MSYAYIAKYSLLSFPIASFGLGVWQIKRLDWKKGVIADLEKRTSEDPIEIKSILNLKDLRELEYRRVFARGHYDTNPNNQIYLKPRQLVVNDEAYTRGRTSHQPLNGVNVITPFHVEGTDTKILVNRGWLPTRGKGSAEDSAHVGLGKQGENIDLVGVLRTTDKRPHFGAQNNVITNEWQFRDVENLARALRTAPIYLDADLDARRTEGPIGGQTHLNVRNEHLNYAITWFSLSVLAYVLWYSKYGKFRFRFFKRNEFYK